MPASVDTAPLNEFAQINTVEALRRIASFRDAAAWSAILLNHGAGILRMAERIVGPALADDACQETLLQIRAHAHQFSMPSGARNAEGAARGWIMSIAYRTALGMLRLNKRRDSNEQRAEPRNPRMASAPDDALLLKEQLELLRREVAELPETLRGAICLHYYGEMSYPDLSSTLACSEDVARKRVERGVSELRARLAAVGMTVGVSALAAALAGSAGATTAAAGGVTTAVALEQLGAWQALLHSSHAPVLAGIVKWGEVAIMGKYIVGTAALLALALSGVQTWRTHSLSNEVNDLRRDTEASVALQEKIDALEKKLAHANGDIAALKANLTLRNEELVRLQQQANSVDRGANKQLAFDDLIRQRVALGGAELARAEEQRALAKQNRVAAEQALANMVDEKRKLGQWFLEKAKAGAVDEKTLADEKAKLADELFVLEAERDAVRNAAIERDRALKMELDRVTRQAADEKAKLAGRLDDEKLRADTLDAQKANDFRVKTLQAELDRAALDQRNAQIEEQIRAAKALKNKAVKPPAPPKDEKANEF